MKNQIERRGAPEAANCECHDRTQARYRSSFQGQIDQSRGMVAEVKKRNPEWSEILEQAMAPYRKRVETLESGHVVLLEALRLAKTRLEICLGRMRGCGDFHEVSVEEIPAWIEEMETLIGGPPSKPGHIYYGPHPCDVCGKKICRISVEQGGVKFDYPEGIIYPNTNWVQHVCEAEAAIQQAERT